MPCNQVQKNNIGTVFRVTFIDCDAAVIDISAATTKEIIFKTPDGTRLAKAGSYATNGTDGKLDYASESGFLSVTGVWSIQGHVIIGAQDLYTEVDTFGVLNNI